MKTLNNRIVFELVPLETIRNIHVPIELQNSASQLGKVRYLPQQTWIRENDYILFHRFCAKDIEINEEKLKYVDIGYILGVLRK